MKLRKGLALLLVLLLLGSTSALAVEIPDTSRTGSVSITMTCEGSVVSGGTLTLYRVGEVTENNGSYDFTLTDDFAGSGADLSDISSPDLAAALTEYAESVELSGTTAEIAADGTVKFEKLELGLYLLVQYEAASGYYAVSPFLVSVPMYTDGAYVYDVDASPKVEVNPSPSPEPSEEPSPSPSASASPSPSTSPSPSASASPGESPSPSPSPTLPYTGQLNWPVPVLVIAGLLLLSVGFVLIRKKNSYEK